MGISDAYLNDIYFFDLFTNEIPKRILEYMLLASKFCHIGNGSCKPTDIGYMINEQKSMKNDCEALWNYINIYVKLANQ